MSVQKATEFDEITRRLVITPFKVTDFGTDRKLLYDFLLLINSNLPPIFHRFQVMVQFSLARGECRLHGAPQSALSHRRSTIFLSVQHDKLWPTSIFVRRPSCLELNARTSATNHFNRPFQTLSKNVFIRADIALSALDSFLFSGLYKFTYLLDLLLPGA